MPLPGLRDELRAAAEPWVVRGGAAMAAAAAATGLVRPDLGDALEIAFYLCVAVALWASTPVRVLLRRFPPPHRSILVGLVALIIMGAIDDDSDENFPFVAWQMYGDLRYGLPPTVEFFRLRAVTADGTRVPMPLAELYSTVSYGVETRIRETARSALKDRPRPGSALELDALLRAVGRTYERVHPETRVGRIELWRHRLRRRDAARNPDGASEVVWSVPLEGTP